MLLQARERLLLAAMTKLPTLRTLAAELGLSAATVSEALRDSPRVKEQTRMRVHQAAAAVEVHGRIPVVRVPPFQVLMGTRLRAGRDRLQ